MSKLDEKFIRRLEVNQTIVNNLLYHAVTCNERWCVCKASSFRDAIVDLKKVETPQHKKIIKEIFENDTNR